MSLALFCSRNFKQILGDTTGPTGELALDGSPIADASPVTAVEWDRPGSTKKSTVRRLGSILIDTSKRSQVTILAQQAPEFWEFFGGLPEGGEDACMAGLPMMRVARLVVSMLFASVIAGSFFAAGLVLSAFWAVPSHEQATFWDGFCNRMAWALSPILLGGFFPGLCTPGVMTDRRIHLYFITISLTPFVIADVAFPYIVGSDAHWKVFFSTCFWPTLTCVFFLPSMIAGIRCCKGDENWSDVTSHWNYIRAEGAQFWKHLIFLLVSFAAAVLPVNYIALDFAVVLPNLHPTAAALVRPLISTVIKIGCFEIFKLVAFNLSTSLRFYGMFPLSVNLGLHTAMSAVLCQDWFSVGFWLCGDFGNSLWRTLRTRRCLHFYFPCLNRNLCLRWVMFYCFFDVSLSFKDVLPEYGFVATHLGNPCKS